MDDNELKHFGVPGMKWGVRKASRSSGGTSKTTKNAEKKSRSVEKQKVKDIDSKTKTKGKTAVKVALGALGGAAVATAAILGKDRIKSAAADAYGSAMLLKLGMQFLIANKRGL